MPCSANFLMSLQNEILSTETSDFLNQIIFMKSFNSVLNVVSMAIKYGSIRKHLSGETIYYCASFGS